MRQKVNRTDLSWNLKILWATVTKNFEILKIAGSRAEFLDFDFEIKNFFWKQAIILIKGQNSKFRRDKALQNLYVVAKISFFEDQKKSVGQYWFGARPLIFSILQVI